MERNLNIALVGLAAGAAVLAAVELHTWNLVRVEQAAETRCRAEWSSQTDPWMKYAYPCDAASVATRRFLSLEATEVLESQQAINRWEERSRDWMLVGALFAFGGSTPWLWYFVLRRLREVSHALTGK